MRVAVPVVVFHAARASRKSACAVAAGFFQFGEAADGDELVDGGAHRHVGESRGGAGGAVGEEPADPARVVVFPGSGGEAGPHLQEVRRADATGLAGVVHAALGDGFREIGQPRGCGLRERRHVVEVDRTIECGDHETPPVGGEEDIVDPWVRKNHGQRLRGRHVPEAHGSAVCRGREALAVRRKDDARDRPFVPHGFADQFPRGDRPQPRRLIARTSGEHGTIRAIGDRGYDLLVRHRRDVPLSRLHAVQSDHAVAFRGGELEEIRPHCRSRRIPCTPDLLTISGIEAFRTAVGVVEKPGSIRAPAWGATRGTAWQFA